MLTWPICLILLVGTIAGGNSAILCIGDSGLVEFKTLCLPIYCDAGESCDDGLLGERQDELADCSHCSDLELDGPLRSNRIQRTDSYQLAQFALELAINAHSDQLSIENGNSRIKILYLLYGQSPPTYSIYSVSTTVFRC